MLSSMLSVRQRTVACFGLLQRLIIGAPWHNTEGFAICHPPWQIVRL